ncbi:MAG: response regulator transcription factor [Chloroflexota bacterium]
MTTPAIRVAILDDHQSIIDGYVYRLNSTPGFEVVATLYYGEDLKPALAAHPADVLLLDINVPTSAKNPNPYPILHEIPALLQMYPALHVLVISMYAERGLIRAVIEAGASGYVLKDDRTILLELGTVIQSIVNGGICFSQKANQLLLKGEAAAGTRRLSTRQVEVMSLAAAYPDASSAELAQKMAVSNSTVRNLLAGAYIKLGVHNRSGAIARARQLGLITPDPPTGMD